MPQAYIKLKQFTSFINSHLVGIIVIVMLTGLYFSSLYSYQLFHSLVEMSSIVVAASIFIIVFNVRRMTDNRFIIFLSVSYFSVSIISTLHTLAYIGMGAFPGYDANLQVQLWTLSRYVESFSLIFAVLFIRRKSNYRITIISYGAITGSLITLIFLKIFPVCYIEGTGLTLFKIISEYVIILILIAVIALLYFKREDFDEKTFKYMILAIFFSIGVELPIVQIYSISDPIGHYFKLFSFYMIYKAVIESSLQDPVNVLFYNLKNRKTDLENQKNDLELLLSILSHDLRNHHTVALGSLDLAKEMVENEEYSKVSGILDLSISGVTSAENLLDYISIILIQQLSHEYQLYPVNVRSVCDRCIGNLSKIYPKKKIVFDTEIPSDCQILADSLFEQLIINLLSNVVKKRST